MTSLRICFLTALSFVLLAGCDDDPVPMDAGDSGVPTDDGGPLPDTTAPTVASTSPRDAATGVDPAIVISVRFSEPMDESGSVALIANDEALEAPAVAWSDDGFAITVTPAATLPEDASIEVSFAGFADVAGNALTGGAFEFRTGDRSAPRVTSSTPAEGATDVAVELDEIEITFDEGMDMDRGRLVLEGGTGTIGELTWAGATVTATVSGLDAENEYAIRLVDFADRSGNLVDEAAYLIDGAIDFTTGADDRAPTIVESDPREGQLDVSLTVTTRLALRFSERMDTAVGAATLTVDGESTPLTLEWQDNGTRATLDVTGFLAADAVHAVTFTGFADLAGNALDTTTYLVDGALDFTTGEDSFVPFIPFTSPEDGAVEVTDQRSIVIVFSERMSAELDTIVLRDDDGRVLSRQGVWGESGTYLTVPLVPGDLLAGFSYTVDLREFQDTSGTSVDAGHAYLGDGVLQFTTPTARTGETCGDALTVAEADVSGGVHTWSIASATWTSIDGGIACDTTPTADGVIYYRKTTPRLADGGTALRVRAQTDNGNLEIYAGTCGVGTPIADAARQRCLLRQSTWETVLDVGPGDYFVWVSDLSGSFNAGSVVIEETAAPLEGEGCAAPYDVTTSAPIYTAPVAAGDSHVWVIPEDSAFSIERTVSHDTAPLSCSAEPYGNDAVVRFDKTSDTSVLVIEVESASGSIDVEISDACDARTPGRTEIRCYEALGTEGRRRYETTIGGPAGPRFVWLNATDPEIDSGWSAFPGATVRIVEIDSTTPGDSCANAIPISPGTSIPITADRPHRVHAPSCLSGGVTWYRYTATERLGIVRASNGAGMGNLDPTSLTPLQCRTSTLDERLPVVAEPGTDVCIGIASTGTATLSIEERPYTGVAGRVTDMRVPWPYPPVSGVSIASQYWLAATPTTVLSGGFEHLYFASPSGGAMYSWWETPTSDLPGDGAIVIDDALYVLHRNDFSPTAPASRISRITGFLSGSPTVESVDVIEPAYPDGGVPPQPYPIGLNAQGNPDGVALNAITSFGSDLWVVPDTSAPAVTSTYFFTVPIAGGPPVQVGVNDALQSVAGIAVDDTHVYVMANVGGSTGTEGIWRLERSELSDPSAIPFLVYSNGLNFSGDNGGIHLGSTAGSKWLYFRSYSPSDVHLVLDVDTDAPIDLGRLWTIRGDDSRPDQGLGYDPTGPALYVIDTSITTFGHWYRID